MKRILSIIIITLFTAGNLFSAETQVAQSSSAGAILIKWAVPAQLS
jgi:hypothetical protein